MFGLFSSKPSTFEAVSLAANEEQAQFKGQLHQLALFIRTPQNREILFSGEKGGEINFAGSPLQHFDIHKPAHSALLKHTLNQYETQLKKLQTTDFKLGLSLVMGLVAIALAPLSMGFTTLLSAVAFSFFGYYCKAREDSREAYVSAQQDMTNVYIWAMNDPQATITAQGKRLPAESAIADQTEFAKAVQDSLDPQIVVMHNVVNPMLSDQNIWHYTRNDLDQAITIDKAARNEDAVANETTTKLQLSLSYLLYGEHQGSSVQVAKGVAEYAKRAVVDLAHQVHQVFSSKEPAAAEQFTKEAAETVVPNMAAPL